MEEPEPDPTAPPVEEEPEEAEDGGISDGERIVRVWVEDGRLTKVRVSPNWWTKLQRRPGTSLAEVFSTVFQIAHVQAGGAPMVNREEYEVELTPEFARSLPELSQESLARMQEHYAALGKRIAEQRRRLGPQRPAGKPVAGEAKGVKVLLNGNGRASSVEFDEAWLEDTNAGAISRNVLAAAQDSYGKFAPDRDLETLLGETHREYDYLRKVMNAILVPKENR